MAKLPIVVLFGYESSTFTLKIRLALKLKQIPYTFVAVSSMMPRPVLRGNFHLTYRKIPVLAIGKDIYCDTSLICEALEHFFPASDGYPSLYPAAADGRTYRPLIRGFVSYYTDRALFRVTTGLIPSSVWRSSFGQDRGQLIGHKLDADKLEKKMPENLSKFDLQLSMLEPLFTGDGPWIFSASTPSLADISVFYQLQWGRDIAAGHYVENLTGGAVKDTNGEGAEYVFNVRRCPGTFSWYERVQKYFQDLQSTESNMTIETVLELMRETPGYADLLHTPQPGLTELDVQSGLKQGSLVAITPDDTGRNE